MLSGNLDMGQAQKVANSVNAFVDIIGRALMELDYRQSPIKELRTNIFKSITLIGLTSLMSY